MAAEQAYRFCEVAVEVRTAVSAEGVGLVWAAEVAVRYTPALSWAAGYVPAPARLGGGAQTGSCLGGVI